MNVNFSKKAQGGFTLIELIVVIVILGILAATALPKFASLSGDARVASLQGAKGAVSAASAMLHGKWLVKNESPIEAEGVNIRMTADGYPIAADIALAAGLTDDYVSDPATPAADAATVTFYPKNLPEKFQDTCKLTYTQKAADGPAPVITVTSRTCE